MEHDQQIEKGTYVVEGICDADNLKFQFWRLFSEEPLEPAEDMYLMNLDSIELEDDDDSSGTAHRGVAASQSAPPSWRPKAPPPWRIGFTPQFKKDVDALDRKLQGRILEVLQDISNFVLPFKTAGDTFKPLRGNLKGYWRYRIGDFRLVINPVVAESEIDVITFSARGDVYD